MSEKKDKDTQQSDKEIVYLPTPYMQEAEEDEIDLLELWNVLWKGKWFICFFTFLCTLGAALVSLYALPVIYQSDAVLQPTNQKGQSKLQSIAGKLPVSVPGMSSGGSNTQIMDFLSSRKLKLRLIHKYDLLRHLYSDIWNEEKQTWEIPTPKDKPTPIKAIQNGIFSGYFSASKDEETGLITINWSDKDPAFARTMIERIIHELRHYLEKEYVSDAKRERKFVEQQLEKATKELEYWEGQVPHGDLTLSKIQRERTAAQKIYTELRKQLELAKIKEAKELVSFKILDEPYVPQEKAKPKRSLICALTMVTTAFLGIFLVFFRQFIINVRKRKDEQGE